MMKMLHGLKVDLKTLKSFFFKKARCSQKEQRHRVKQRWLSAASQEERAPGCSSTAFH